jgi:hypothetical protein
MLWSCEIAGEEATGGQRQGTGSLDLQAAGQIGEGRN